MINLVCLASFDVFCRSIFTTHLQDWDIPLVLQDTNYA